MKSDLFQTSAIIIPDPEMEEFTWSFQVPPQTKIQKTIEIGFGGGFNFSGLKFKSGFIAELDHKLGFSMYQSQVNTYLILPKRDLHNRYTVKDVVLELLSESKVNATHTLKVSMDEHTAPPKLMWSGFWKNMDGSWNDTIDTFRVTFRILRESRVCQNYIFPKAVETTCKEVISRAKEVDCKEFLMSKDLSDVVIECKGKDYPAHRILLSSRSSVFNRMFQVRMKEVNEGRVLIEDIEPEVLQELLRFMYTGEVDAIGEICVELFQAAHKYDVEPLKVMCEIAMIGKICPENALEMYMLAEVHDSTSLKGKALEEIQMNKKKVFQDLETYREFASRYPDLTFQLLALG